MTTHHSHQLEEPVLDAETTRATLRSMAALTRTILGVALQGPPEAAAPAVTPAATQSAPPAALALPPEPEAEAGLSTLGVVPRPGLTSSAAALDPDWTPSLAGAPSLAVVDPLPAAPERQNLGLLAELAFLDD